MYTKKKLESETFQRLYKHVGKKSNKMINKIEETINQKDIKKEIKVDYNDANLLINGKYIKYTNYSKLGKNDEYLKSIVIKERDKEPLDISFQIIIHGFDYVSSERFERKKAEISYIYHNNKIKIYNIKDEDYFNKYEELNKEKTKKRVLKLKKDLSM